MKKEKIEDYKGWKGSLNRLQAEKILYEKPIGTYLLRKGDDVTSAMQAELSKENHIPIKCYVLTMVEAEDKIRDILIIKEKDKWTLYHDDPDLIHTPFPTFESLDRLIDELKGKIPLKAL